MLLQQIITGISIGGIYALLATGYSLIYSLLDFSNWSHGEFAMIGAYVAIVVSNMLGAPFAVAAIAGVAGGAAISFLSERFTYRRIRSNGAPNMFLMIAAEKSYEEIAEVLGCSVPAVETRRSNGKKAAKKIMRRLRSQLSE